MQSIFLPYNQNLSYPDIINLLSFFLISDAKVRTFVFAHKHFRRKVSEHPDFLIKVKNLYIPITKSGTDYTDYTDLSLSCQLKHIHNLIEHPCNPHNFCLCLRPVTVGSGRTDKSEGEPFARHQAKNTSDRRPAGFEIRR